MPRMLWPLRHGRPCVEIVLTLTQGGHPFPRTLLADTGAGSQTDPFELVLDEGDCLVCGGFAYLSVPLGGSYAGIFPLYDLPVQVPALGFVQTVRAVGVTSVPAGFDGIACFRFLNRFTYGNFGDPGRFGLEI
jgi:hypothetical protein